MNDHDLENLFPNLKTSPFKKTSPETPNYNCIAWALNDSSKWWWPDSYNSCFWPPTVPRLESINAFIEAFGTIGYEICNDSEREKGFQKVAIYATKEGRPKHATRQLSNGCWTSKIGDDIDIEHELAGLIGEKYGEIVVVMKRKIKS